MWEEKKYCKIFFVSPSWVGWGRLTPRSCSCVYINQSEVGYRPAPRFSPREPFLTSSPWMAIPRGSCRRRLHVTAACVCAPTRAPRAILSPNPPRLHVVVLQQTKGGSRKFMLKAAQQQSQHQSLRVSSDLNVQRQFFTGGCYRCCPYIQASELDETCGGHICSNACSPCTLMVK